MQDEARYCKMRQEIARGGKNQQDEARYSKMRQKNSKMIEARYRKMRQESARCNTYSTVSAQQERTFCSNIEPRPLRRRRHLHSISACITSLILLEQATAPLHSVDTSVTSQKASGADQWEYCVPIGNTLTNEITGNRIQNNAQSAVLVVAVTGCWTESLENASFLTEHRLRYGLRTRGDNFNHIWELSTISSWTLLSSSEKVAQRTVSARLPRHSFVQQSRTQCSVPRIRPFTHVSCSTDFPSCDDF